MTRISQSYVNGKSFDTYRMYLAMHRHFNSNYDFHKYNGKVNAKIESFRTKNDVLFFHVLSEKQNVKEILLANLLHNKKMYITEMLSDAGQQRYLEWRKRQEMLTRVVKEDLNKLDDNWQSNFVSTNGQHPLIMTLYLQKQITLETFTILVHIANIFEYWDKEVVDKIIACDIIKLSRKYRPFLSIDEKKFKDVVKHHFF